MAVPLVQVFDRMPESLAERPAKSTRSRVVSPGGFASATRNRLQSGTTIVTNRPGLNRGGDFEPGDAVAGVIEIGNCAVRVCWRNVAEARLASATRNRLQSGTTIVTNRPGLNRSDTCPKSRTRCRRSRAPLGSARARPSPAHPTHGGTTRSSVRPYALGRRVGIVGALSLVLPLLGHLFVAS
jgi:hypothetical protein